jgi:hypothetical protein
MDLETIKKDGSQTQVFETSNLLHVLSLVKKKKKEKRKESGHGNS